MIQAPGIAPNTISCELNSENSCERCNKLPSESYSSVTLTHTWYHRALSMAGCLLAFPLYLGYHLCKTHLSPKLNFTAAEINHLNLAYEKLNEKRELCTMEKLLVVKSLFTIYQKVYSIEASGTFWQRFCAPFKPQIVVENKETSLRSAFATLIRHILCSLPLLTKSHLRRSSGYSRCSFCQVTSTALGIQRIRDSFLTSAAISPRFAMLKFYTQYSKKITSINDEIVVTDVVKLLESTCDVSGFEAYEKGELAADFEHYCWNLLSDSQKELVRAHVRKHHTPMQTSDIQDRFFPTNQITVVVQ